MFALLKSKSKRNGVGARGREPPRSFWRAHALGIAAAMFLQTLAFGTLDAGEVTIVRDTYWVPHIIGDGPFECGYGLGRAISEDRPGYFIYRLLEIRGRLASVYRPSLLYQDSTAESTFAHLPPDVASYFRGFALGCTHYFEEHPEVLPPGAAADAVLPMTAVDAFALGSLYPVSHQWKQMRAEARSVWPEIGCSNPWAIGLRLKRDGAGYLLCDPHLPFEQFFGGSYEAHLLSRDGLLDFEGCFNGPYAMMGHNRHLAWSHTYNSPDCADAYLLELDPQDPNRYLLDGESWPFEVWQEIIPVAGAEPDTETFRVSPHHGLVVRKIDAHHVLAARLELMGRPPPGEQMFRMMTAQSVAEFREAMALHRLDRLNTVALDDQGDLWYVYNARVHRRPDPVAARSGPLDGSTSSALWGELIPFASLPAVLNPGAGFLLNCNDAPWFVTLDPGFGPQDVPSELYSGNSFGLRGRRTLELISPVEGAIDVNYLKSLCLDVKVAQWDSVAPALAKALQESAARSYPRQPFAEELAARLFSWHGRAATDAPAMTLFYEWYLSLEEQVNFLRPSKIDNAERQLLVEKLVEAGDDLLARFGTVDVPWGEVHGFYRAGRWYPVSGDKRLQTLRLGGWRTRDSQGRFLVDSGDYYVMLVRLKRGEPPQAWSMQPYGQSYDSTSTHYADLTALYSADSLRRTWYQEQEFRAHAERVKHFVVNPSGVGGRLRTRKGPTSFSLAAWPNPFNRSLTVELELSGKSRVRLGVYNVLGQRVALLREGAVASGIHRFKWEAPVNLAPGVYLLTLEVDGELQRVVKVVHGE